jgi:tryptophan halogenase
MQIEGGKGVMAIEKIVIVGGGTAGWMAAAALSRLRAGRDVAITLVESEMIGTVGVGEATIPPFLDFNRLLEVDEREMLSAVQGSFKLGIQFVNWGKIGDSYIHPFGNYGYQLGGMSFHHIWHKYKAAGDKRPIQVFNLETMAAHFGRFARTEDFAREDLPPVNYAYHLDAGRYARYLRGYAEKRGVARLEGKVNDVAIDGESGFVSSITLEDGTKIAGDLFIDCSGFRGLLIEGALHSEYVDWSKWLPCNRALAVPCESAEKLLPYTRASAREAGWQWRIPLQHRTGNGYVYSSQYIGDDEAADTLLRNLDGRALREPRLLRFTTGMRRKIWNRNCVSVGLASGFLEPLESTSIYLIQSCIARLVNLLPDRDFSPVLIDRYNAQARFEFERIRDFIILHYHATERSDAPLWNYCRTMSIPEQLAENIRLFRDSGRFFRDGEEMFALTSWVQVMLGQHIVPRSYHPAVDEMPEDELVRFAESVRKVIANCVDAMPMHSQFIARHCQAAQEQP